LSIWEGIVTGAAGGASAGIIIMGLQGIKEYYLRNRDTNRILDWLREAAKDSDAKKWRTTHAIASYTNLTEDRVRFLCSTCNKIARSTKEKEVWALWDIVRKEED